MKLMMVVPLFFISTSSTPVYVLELLMVVELMWTLASKFVSSILEAVPIMLLSLKSHPLVTLARAVTFAQRFVSVKEMVWVSADVQVEAVSCQEEMHDRESCLLL